jgi:hypothetical protein
LQHLLGAVSVLVVLQNTLAAVVVLQQRILAAAAVPQRALSAPSALAAAVLKPVLGDLHVGALHVALQVRHVYKKALGYKFQLNFLEKQDLNSE